MSEFKDGVDPTQLESTLVFDEEGLHYLVDSEHVSEAEGYEFISSAYVDKEDLKDRKLYITFRDGYLSDFNSEDIARDLDDHLGKVDGIEKSYQEDREFFEITFEEGQDIPALIKKIDAAVTELSTK